MVAPIYKSEVFEICRDIAKKFDGVTFSDHMFTVKTAKFVRTQIYPGFTFKYGEAKMDPSIWVSFRKLSKLTTEYTGRGCNISKLDFMDIKSELIKFPKENTGITNICREIPAYAIRNNIPMDYYKLIEDLPRLLEAMVDDGVRLLHKLYDFSSERSFLENMPPKYDPPPLDIPMPNYVGIPHTEYSTSSGIAMCLVRMSLGDFDFIDLYESDEFNPFTRKSRDRLRKLREALPDLKKKYEETGRIY